MEPLAPGTPPQPVPVDDDAALKLKARTLTNLYSARPTWVANTHADLDRAVLAAYGWAPDTSDEEILAGLLKLNRARSEQKQLTLAEAPRPAK